MYSTNSAIINNTEFNSSYMPVGINEDVTLTEVSVKKSTSNKDFIEFVFTNKDNQTVKMSEWKNEKNMWIKTDEDLQNRDNQQFGRILQIIDAVKGGHGEFEGSSFLEMINWVASQLSSGEPNRAVRLKVIYDKNGYTIVSPHGVFIEPTTVTESQIKLFKRDLLERPIKADIEKPADPFAGVNTNTSDSETNDGADDLPF